MVPNCLLPGYPSAAAPILFDFAPLVPRLEVVDTDDQRSIFLNGHLAGRYACDDKGTVRVLVTQLAEVSLCPIARSLPPSTYTR